MLRQRPNLRRSRPIPPRSHFPHGGPNLPGIFGSEPIGMSRSILYRLTEQSIVVSYDGMETVTISPKFQVVIPQKVREAMGLRSGEKAKVFSFRNRIEIVPARDIRALRGYLKGIDTSILREGDRL